MKEAGTVAASAASVFPHGWNEVLPLLDRALDVPKAERAAALPGICGGNSHLLASLESILAECDSDPAFFRTGALDRFDQLADDDDPELPETFSGRYRIARRIARGGMARVYLARDLKHERDVALKIIRPEVAVSIGRELFLREIAIAARLRHPNIVPLYDSGDESGVLYFVMPYESGRSLREKIRDGPISSSEALPILRDVARALEYAHAQGVTHRDIKPDNVMLSEGTAVVTDFGISVAVRAAQIGNSSTKQETQSALGTPAYIAPEQAAGDPATDHRADIYSFGCMAYELLCGRLPFDAANLSATPGAHRGTKAQPMSASARKLSPALVSLIGRCLETDPDKRPQRAAELISAIDDAAAESSAMKSRAWIYAAASVAAVVALSMYVIFSTRTHRVDSGVQLPIVVLPFKSIGADQQGSPLARGFSEEIASSLVEVPWLRVMSRAGSAGYASNTDFRKTGLELGARFIVTGTLQQAADHIRVSVGLIDASDGSTRWTAHFDRPRAQLEGERDEIVRETAAALMPLASQRLTRSTPVVPVARPVNGEAYFLQVQAQQWLDRRGQSVKLSADYFRRAIAIDTGYAKAYSGLSLALALYPYFQNTPASDVRSEVMTNARRALELDPTLAQPHIAMGLALQHDYKWGAAAAQFDSAVFLAPHDVEARVQYGRHLLFRGKTPEALAQFQAARADDPASSLVLGWVAYAFFIAKKLDSARVLSQRAVDSNSLSLSSVANAALMHLDLGEKQEARRLISQVPLNFPVAAYVRSATVGTDPDAARGSLDLTRRPWMANTIRAYILLGRRDGPGAVNALEAATAAREIWPSILPVTDPLFDPLRGDQRFQNVLTRVGLAP